MAGVAWCQVQDTCTGSFVVQDQNTPPLWKSWCSQTRDSSSSFRDIRNAIVSLAQDVHLSWDEGWRFMHSCGTDCCSELQLVAEEHRQTPKKQDPFMSTRTHHFHFDFHHFTDRLCLIHGKKRLNRVWVGAGVCVCVSPFFVHSRPVVFLTATEKWTPGELPGGPFGFAATEYFSVVIPPPATATRKVHIRRSMRSRHVCVQSNNALLWQSPEAQCIIPTLSYLISISLETYTRPTRPTSHHTVNVWWLGEGGGQPTSTCVSGDIQIF